MCMNSYKLVARNTALCHKILKQMYGNLFSEDVYLYLSACADALPYVLNGKIEPERVAQAVTIAHTGMCGIGLTVNRYANFIINPPSPLCGMIIQLECLLFAAESVADARSIVQMVPAKRAVIEKAIEKVECGKYSDEEYNACAAQVVRLMKSPECECIRAQANHLSNIAG